MNCFPQADDALSAGLAVKSRYRLIIFTFSTTPFPFSLCSASIIRTTSCASRQSASEPRLLRIFKNQNDKLIFSFCLFFSCQRLTFRIGLAITHLLSTILRLSLSLHHLGPYQNSSKFTSASTRTFCSSWTWMVLRFPLFCDGFRPFYGYLCRP